MRLFYYVSTKELVKVFYIGSLGSYISTRRPTPDAQYTPPASSLYNIE